MDTLQKILELLQQRNIDQQELAKFIGVGRFAVTEWKSGKTKSYMKYIDKIAAFFNVSADYLLGTEQKEKPQPELEGWKLEIIKKLESFTPEQRKQAHSFLEFLASNPDNLKIK